MRSEVFNRCWPALEWGQVEEARFELYLMLTRDLMFDKSAAEEAVHKAIYDNKICFRRIEAAFKKEGISIERGKKEFTNTASQWMGPLQGG